MMTLVLSLFVLSACRTTAPQTQGPSALEKEQAQKERAQALFLHGNDALDRGEWEIAINRYNEALALDQRWDIHMNRGIALTRQNRFRDATDAFAAALDAGGHQEYLLYYNLGNLYQERGLYEKSIDAYRTSLSYRGELEYETLLNIGAAYTFVHAYEDARITITRAIEMNPDDPRAHLSLALIIFSEEQPDQALRLYDELVANFPDFGPAHFNRGFVLMRTGDREGAIEAFQTYLRLEPEGPYARQADSNINILRRRM